ncbi:toxin-antitoxin system HicB family antitoxin [Desulfonatronovibrio magnus]|uniref:toxin-antitoxin system HicB family antitoxin n=1 Tax=Desulfonatronovibrio magnus TaxID=698827 RepID=UPI0005EBDAEA|nr:toxin-antitoxin system HicB family antitoxin [Desulfonatronovibrio magnus]
MNNYSIHLVWDEEHEGYAGFVPELPEVKFVEKQADLGKAINGVVRMAHQAVKAREMGGDAVPDNCALGSFSGQFRLRLPRNLHTALAREAQVQGVSLNSYIMYLLSTRYSQEKTLQKVAEVYEAKIEATVREVHEMVSSMTFGEPETDGLVWNSTQTGSVIAQ